MLLLKNQVLMDIIRNLTHLFKMWAVPFLGASAALKQDTSPPPPILYLVKKIYADIDLG